MASAKRKKRPAHGATKRPSAQPPSNRRLYGSLALLVAGLAALVWWSLPGSSGLGGTPHEEGHDAGATATSAGADAGGSMTRLQRPSLTFAELAIITDKAESAVHGVASVTEIEKHLDVRHCGDACDAVRKLMSDEDAFELDVVKAADLLLPPSDTLDTVAAGLTAEQRESVHRRPVAVVIRTRGPTTPEQLPARAAYAIGAVLAERLDGFVYDEVARRIETAQELMSQTITAKLGQPAFARRHIVVQLYRQEDGTARLLTLGMARFGSPDVSIRGASMSSAPPLAEVINAVASQVARGADAAPFTVTLAEIARLVGKKPAELNPKPDTARPVRLGIAEPERIEGDPDNEMVELLPEGGPSREAWDAVVKELFGMTPAIVAPEDDPKLAEVAQRARRDLPQAIRRFEAGEGELFLKGPFPIPIDARDDGGAAAEMLWLEAASCDARMCTGVLSNEPSYATNIALGKTASVKRDEAVDWMIRLRDGGISGGESMKILRDRAR